MLDQGGIFGVEQPHPWQGGVSMFQLDCFKELAKRGADLVVFDQCMHEGPATKPTQILYFGAAFHQLEVTCNHPAVKLVDARGRLYYAAHPKVVQQRGADGAYRTKALAAYPPALNKRLARIMAEATRDRCDVGAP